MSVIVCLSRNHNSFFKYSTFLTRLRQNDICTAVTSGKICQNYKKNKQKQNQKKKIKIQRT